MNKKGFTLIELLAVIVILGIIISLTIVVVTPVMNKSRKRALLNDAITLSEAARNKYADDKMNQRQMTSTHTQNSVCYSIKDDLIGPFASTSNDDIQGSVEVCFGENCPYITKVWVHTGKYAVSGKVNDDLTKDDISYVSDYDDEFDYTNCEGLFDEGDYRPICKRAIALHTETCSQTTAGYFCNGDGYTETGSKGTTTITYGNLGNGNTLVTGDAFDCDVNGDGIYDEATERFYYITDLNNATAILVYYNNVLGGLPNNKSLVAYNLNDSGYLGPDTAKLELPTTSQWSYVSLVNPIRDIKDEKGDVALTKFSYEGYAARLLSYEELEAGCYDGTTSLTTKPALSSKCRFIMENSKYASNTPKANGILLETLRSNTSGKQCFITHAKEQRLTTLNVNSTTGVRPVIEVPKSKIKLSSN